MKLTLSNIKELKRRSDSPLTKRVCNYVIDRWGDYDDKKWEIVLVYALDRFGRNSVEIAVNKQRLHKNGKILISATQRTSQNIDGSQNLDGIILENVMIGFKRSNGHNKSKLQSKQPIQCTSKAIGNNVRWLFS